MYHFGFLSILAALFFFVTSGDPVTAQEGSCNYTIDNRRGGPYKVCSGPMDAEACTAQGEADGISNASYNAGTCSQEGSVGSCVAGTSGSVVYYEGDPGLIETGCGYQNGTWEAAE